MAKKKSKLKTKKPEIEELDGYKLGQNIYCKRYPDGKLSYGRIEQFHPNTEGGKAVTFVDFITSKYRLTLMEDIIDNPTPKQLESCQSQIALIKRSRKKDKSKA